MPLSKQSISQAFIKTYEQSCHCGESAHPPTIWPGFDFLTHRYMWPEFVASLLCSEMFSPEYSSFALSSKTSNRFYLMIQFDF